MPNRSPGQTACSLSAVCSSSSLTCARTRTRPCHRPTASLQITGIDPFHPLRAAVDEGEALRALFNEIRKEIKLTGCNRAILVGHNSFFDLQFLNAAVERVGIKRNPFHPFSSFDTVTLAGVAYGQTVLGRAVAAAGFDWNDDNAHSALYDAEKAGELFCAVVNRFRPLYGG